MSTLEDSILGEKKQYYCSSSENESDDEGEQGNRGRTGSNLKFIPEDKIQQQTHWSGNGANTGPKGVIRDWQRYKQLETEKRDCQEQEKLDLIKKLSITTSSDSEAKGAAKQEMFDNELAELMDEDFLFQYQKKRMAELLAIASKLPTFGTLIELRDGDEFLNAIDGEQNNVTIVIHIYNHNDSACKNMNKALCELAVEYKNVKFCKFISTAAGLSMSFKSTGVPALLAYKAGQMIGNFVRITDDLGEEFNCSDVETFLIEVGVLLDKSCVPVIIK
ncbi:phosducin-like protein [Toxorhynchites rutilus septentrionalis]|uniref:phosducin-like protein n=1 Tax=Toxorhynchites rutilus septentrionalis TaxID=329112 RepID=UPI00247982AE|nr:phosducin-like protein [Toxorhynchites rutilus septentrionalis]